MTLEVDDFGNVLKSAAIGYGRRLPDAALSVEDQTKQSQLLITYTENAFTNSIDGDDVYRAPLPCEARTYELTAFKPENNGARFSFDELARNNFSLLASAEEIPYEETPDSVAKQKRLIEHVRTLYRPDDLGLSRNDPLNLLPLGQVESLALAGESYKLALTPGLITKTYGGKITDRMLEEEGRYVRLADSDGWWIPSGRSFFSPGANDDPATELAYARDHFFLARRIRDPFHREDFNTESIVDYAHDLLVCETRDALGNRVTARNDYRVLQPNLLIDPNGNRSEAAFDTLGMLVGTAIMGKALPAPVQGDTLAGFNRDLDDATVLTHLDNPLADPHAILQGATTRLVYDLFAYNRTKDQPEPKPALVYALARETHETDLALGEQTKVQHSLSYSDGFGREIQKKIQAEPGPLIESGPQARPAMGRDRLDGVQQQGQTGPPVRAVLHRYSSFRIGRARRCESDPVL